MLSVYESFHQTVKYGQQRNHMLQDLAVLEILISPKFSINKDWFSTIELRFAKKAGINIPCLKLNLRSLASVLNWAENWKRS